ncbi:PRD domain-containing protein [Salipaludibacillus sp. LMS25]|jgi:lichenan operon transcriptional antiterminator|uniref:BglG family transcription antiterminator n=1 Tax=Salipaludibacillus sp. LMS25 TaxID=2924031 RepID=UPI0020D0970C|nr:PRD domain-containing protein [Salipaludibacillus sp. LMS25]UTR13232.1 PRD domain-containing protein [Salipaludibacillus sp. LMS25]
MLTQRKQAIFNELLKADSPVSSDDIASIIHVTSRTVRNDIKEMEPTLTENGMTLQSIRGQGYHLKVIHEKTFKNFVTLLSKNTKFTPETPAERVRFMIIKLLLADHYIKSEELAAALHISESTIKNDIKALKKELHRFHISLVHKPGHGLRLQGEERQLRFCMSDYITNRREVEPDITSFPDTLLEHDILNIIHQTVYSQLQAFHIHLSDVSIKNLIIHIAIACKRIKEKNYVDMESHGLTDILTKQEFHIAKLILHKLEIQLNVAFPTSEIAYIALHLLGTNLRSFSDIKSCELKDIMAEDIYRLTMCMLKKIDDKLHLRLFDQELIVALCTHLRPAITRHKYGMNLRNPLLHEIKNHYPVAMEAAIIASLVLKEELNIDIHENEIGFIALHIGAAIERKKLTNHRKKCMIVCATGVGSAKLLYYKLQAHFDGKLEVIGTTGYHHLHNLEKQSLDFIVSTVPIRKNIGIPVVVISAIPTKHDVDRISHVLKNAESKVSFKSFINEDFIFLNHSSETKEEVLMFLAKQLMTKGVVNDTYYDDLMSREKVSPTSFGNLIAIPHPLHPQTERTFLTFCTLKKPIKWGAQSVQLICLLNIEKNSDEDFQQMYKWLANLLDNFQMIKDLIKCTNKQDFLHTLYPTLKGQ